MSFLRSRTVPSIVAVLCLAIVGAVPAFPGSARADTAEDLAKALDAVNQLQSQAEAAFETSESATARLSELNNRVATLQDQLKAQTAAVEAARAGMGRAARNSYMASGVDAGLYLLLSDDGTEFTEALGDLQRVADSKTAALESTRDLEAKVRDTTEQVSSQRAESRRLSDLAAASAQEASKRLDQAEAKYAEIERRYAAELAAQRERQREQDAQIAQAAQASQSSSGNPAPSTQGQTAPSSARQTVINFALSKIGYRYVFGADGPNAYDCSGFAAAAYAAAGIHVASYTYSMAKVVRPIPLSQAKPGDLLFFFGRGANHVAIYLGDGRMVHAANPRTGVTTNALSDAWYRDRLTMVGALLP